MEKKNQNNDFGVTSGNRTRNLPKSNFKMVVMLLNVAHRSPQKHKKGG